MSRCGFCNFGCNLFNLRIMPAAVLAVDRAERRAESRMNSYGTTDTKQILAEKRLRLNRKQGEWIDRNIPEEGGNPRDQLTQNSQLVRPTLSQVGIDKHDSPKFRAKQGVLL